MIKCIYIYIYIYIYVCVCVCVCVFKASRASSHVDELGYNKTVYLWMTIYIFLLRELSTLAKELVVATRVMPSSSNELGTQYISK